jgi:hypothetical protein
MPTSPVHDHGHVLVRCDRLGELVEVDLHHLRRQLRQHQWESVVGAGLGGSEDVGERETLISKPGWTLALGKPDVTDTALLPDPCETGSFIGWLGLALCREKPSRRTTPDMEEG